MKKFLFIILLFGGMVNAQIPNAISFQGVARDANGDCRSNDSLNIIISILDNDSPENVVYAENHNLITDVNGLFAIEIGDGSQPSGNFSNIDWSTKKWVKTVEGTTVLGKIELLTVPYAFYSDRAKKADTAIFALNGVWKNQALADSLGLIDASDKLKALLQVDDQNLAGHLILLPETGNSQGEIYFDGNDQARLALVNASGITTVDLFSDNSENAVLVLRGTASTNQGTIGLGFNDAAGTRPNITLNRGGSNRVAQRVSMDDVGQIQTFGPNSINTWAQEFSSSCPDNGLVAVSDANGIQQASIHVDCAGNGIVAGDMKTFFMNHPTQPGKEIWYCSIEGPEAAAYERGTTQLINGEAEIIFSDHFQIIANPTTMTITTSPWSADSKGLAVVERTATGFKVKELFDGTGNYQFDWRVDAKRKGYEDFQVIRNKRDHPTTNK